MPSELASFWSASELPFIQVASCRSFLKYGNKLTLFVPRGKCINAPTGVSVVDANEIFPSDEIVRHEKTGSAALHADLFRYAMLRSHPSWIWVDLDIIAIRPFVFQTEWVFAFETDNFVSNAVLSLPSNSRTLERLLEIKIDTIGYPPHFSPLRRIKYWFKWASHGRPITQWPWGSTGPYALTHYLRETGEIRHALPTKAFSPIAYSKKLEPFLTPGVLSIKDIPRSCYGVHLYNRLLLEELERAYNGEIPYGSFLEELLHSVQY